MNCPVCNKELEFDLPELEDFYYDCSFCNSSLSFQNGKCEVINRGNSPQSQPNNSEDQSFAESPENISRERESIKQDSAPSFETNMGQPSTEQRGMDQFRDSKQEATPIDQPRQSHKEDSYTKPSNENLSSPESPSFLRKKESSPPQQESILKETSQVSNREVDPSQTNMEEVFSEDPVSLTDEVTEVPEIGEEEPNEFMETEQDLSQEGLAQEDLPQDEASFVFKEEEELELAKEDFSEVIEFSKNKEQKEKGLYLYKLFLSEINSQALKDKVISLLEDESLEIDFQEQYREDIIQKGKIVLPKLSAIQVYVVLHHLMGLPLKVHWEQSHIADS